MPAVTAFVAPTGHLGAVWSMGVDEQAAGNVLRKPLGTPYGSLRTAFEIVVLLAALVASLLIVKELLWRSSPPEPPQPGVAIPSQPLVLAGAPLKGSASSEVVLVVYSDFQCPYCATFARETLPLIEQEYVLPGKLQLAFRHLPLTALHPFAKAGAEIGVCADRDSKFWSWHDVLFDAQEDLKEGRLGPLQIRAGLDPKRISDCLARGVGAAQVGSDLDAAMSLGIKSTPTIILGTRQENGNVKALSVVLGAQPIAAFRVAIDAVLAAPTASLR